MIVAMNRLGDSIGRHLKTDDRERPIGLLGAWVNQCFSRGVLRLQSADPFEQPRIDENMLDDERDRVRLRDGVRRLIDIVREPAVRGIGAVLTGGLDIEGDPSDAAIDQWAMATSGDTQHGTSTCRMGDPNDATTVVDPDCRVLGIEGLRVIDASIMPSVVRANTHLTTVMIGEMMAARLGAGH